jgi:hypothetical protein
MYNLTHFPGPLLCRIRQVALYIFIYIYVHTIIKIVKFSHFKVRVPFITIISQIKIVTFSHFKVQGLPRTLKCENLTIEI